MLELAVPPLEIVLRSAIIYVFLLAGLRLTGKREIGQMTPFDLVVILVLSNAVQNAMVGPDTSLTGGLIAAVTLLALNFLVSRIRRRFRPLERLVEGTPTLLVNDGRFILPHLQKEGIEPDEVLMAMREHGVEDLTQVKMAVLEIDGSISIVPASAASLRTRRRVRRTRRPE